MLCICRPNTSSTEEWAATKIQAFFRGNSTRKSLKTRPSTLPRNWRND